MEFMIFGGNGFIGSNLVAHILRRYPDSSVVNLDLYEDKDLLRTMDIEEFRGRYTFVEGDISDPSSYEGYIKVSDIVINCARENNKEKFQERLERFVKTNILGARILADATGRYEVPLIMITTDEVYGSCSEKTPRREETTPPAPTNPFATTMFAGEKLSALSRRIYNTPLVILRPCTLIGPNQSKNRPVPRMIGSVMEGKPPKVKGRRDAHFRDYLHILDLCSAVDIVLKAVVGKTLAHPTQQDEAVDMAGKTVIHGTEVATKPMIKPPPLLLSPNQLIAGGVAIFNITGEIRYTTSQIAEKVISLMGSELPIQESVVEVYRDMGYNPSRKKVLYQGWSPRYTDIDEILKSTIEWYRDHPEALEVMATGQLMP